MRSVTMFGFILIGKCIDNEIILRMNEDNFFVWVLLTCLVCDIIYFAKKMSK
jgi:hypothetical protein